MSNLTLGELLAEIRNKGLNPEPSGLQHQPGIQSNQLPSRGSPSSQTEIDDISDEQKENIVNYLGRTTKGEGLLKNANSFPVDNIIQRELEMTDAVTGKPSPHTAPGTAQKSFQFPYRGSSPTVSQDIIGDDWYSKQMASAFNLFQEYGFFDQNENILDKNNQASGHTILGQESTKQKISAVLQSSRFNLNSEEKPFVENITDDPRAPGNYFDDLGNPKDHPQIEELNKIYDVIVNQGVFAGEVLPDFAKDHYDSAAGLYPGSSEDASRNRGNEQRVNLTAGEVKEDFDSPNPNYSKKGNGIGGILNPFSAPNTPDRLFDKNSNIVQQGKLIAASAAIWGTLEITTMLLDLVLPLQQVAQKGLRTTAGVNLPYGRRHGVTKNNGSERILVDQDSGKLNTDHRVELDDPAVNLLLALNIPYPRHTLALVGKTKGVKTDWGGVTRLALDAMLAQAKQDQYGFQLQFQVIMATVIRRLSQENNFGLPNISLEDLALMVAQAGLTAALAGGSAEDRATAAAAGILADQKFLRSLREAPAISIIRILTTWAETVAQHSRSGLGSATAFTPFGNLARKRNAAPTRLSQDTRGQGKGLSHRNVPSLFLLPPAFARGREVYRQLRELPGQPHLRGNELTIDDEQYSKLVNSVAKEGLDRAQLKNSAVHTKYGKPMGENANAKRFSREEVEIIENILEGEHLPFYFHDLRTNEIISFHAFLNNLTDSFSPSYSATSGFGRVEDVHIYQKTSRTIGIDFTVVSMHRDDMTEMYFKLNKLISMIYPQYSRGTLLEMTEEYGTTKFTQPFSQVFTGTPIIRLRVGDLIKSNYSREAMSRLMGVDSAEWEVHGDYDPGNVPGTGMMDPALLMPKINQMAKDYDHSFTQTDNADGSWTSVGHVPKIAYPVGTTIILNVNQDEAYGPMISTKNKDGTDMEYSETHDWAMKSYQAVEIVSYEDNPWKTAADAKAAKASAGAFPNGARDYNPVIVMKAATDGGLSSGFPVPMGPWLVPKEGQSTASMPDTLETFYSEIDHEKTAWWTHMSNTVNPHLFASSDQQKVIEDFETQASNEKDKLLKILLSEDNPLYKSFETTAGRGLAGIITSLSFDWGLNSDILWDLTHSEVGFKAPQGCKISLSFTPIHDIPPGLDHNGMMRAPIFNVAGGGPHGKGEDPHDGYEARNNAYKEQLRLANMFNGNNASTKDGK